MTQVLSVMLCNEDTLNINPPSKGMRTKLGGHRIQNAQQSKKNEGEDIKIIEKLGKAMQYYNKGAN